MAPNQPRGPINMKDLGIGKLREQLALLAKTRITVGWQGDTGAAPHPNADASVAQVAMWHEYGTPGSDDQQYDQPRSMIPSRPTLRVAFERNRAEFVDAVKRALSGVIDGRHDLDDAVAQIGETGVAAVQATIDDSRSWAEPLAASTIARKGHDQPLIDTGTMRDAVSWAEREGGSIKRLGGAP